MYEFALLLLTETDGGRAADPDIVRPGWLALGIVAALGVALVILARSFVRQARKANRDWPHDEDPVDVQQPLDPSSTSHDPR